MLRGSWFKPPFLWNVWLPPPRWRHCAQTQLSMGLSHHGEGNGNPLHYSCLENPMDRGACWATVHRVAKSQTRPKRLSMRSHHGRPTPVFVPGESHGQRSLEGYSPWGSHRVTCLSDYLVDWFPTVIPNASLHFPCQGCSNPYPVRRESNGGNLSPKYMPTESV